jgi:hypothetical protein
MAVVTTLTERSLSGELCTLIISVSFPFPNEKYQLISQRRRDVGEFCGGKNWGMCGMLPQMWGISYGVS